MRKILLLFTMATFFTMAGQAQQIDLARLHVGVFGGPNMSTYNMHIGELEAANRFGYQVGVYFRYGETFYLQSGLTFLSINSRLTSSLPAMPPTGPGRVQDRVNTRYLQLPALLGVRFYQQQRNDLSLRLQAGPSLSMLLGMNENELQFSSDQYRDFWFGGQAGLGMDVMFFSLDLGYQMGLSNAFSATNYEGYYRIMTLSLGISF